MAKKETILALCAHNDDQVLGAGGTLAKYAKEGKKVRTIIFSFGEQSHPHLKPHVIIDMRVRESLEADKIMGGAGIAYLGIKEGKFKSEIKKRKIKAKIKNIIQKEKPSKIFTHGHNDHHPDHIAVHKLVMEILNESKLKADVYSFDIWNLVRWRRRNLPRLVVNITRTMPLKVKAIEAHKSQIKLPGVFGLYWRMRIKDRLNGFINLCKYAEVFDKLN